jgi:hypothetical protein
MPIIFDYVKKAGEYAQGISVFSCSIADTCSIIYKIRTTNKNPIFEEIRFRWLFSLLTFASLASCLQKLGQ